MRLRGALFLALVPMLSVPAEARVAPGRRSPVGVAQVRGMAGGVRVGRFTAARTCTTYVLTSGKVGTASSSSTAAATDGFDAAYENRNLKVATAAWRQDLVRDCQSNFPNLRASIERALLAGDVTLNGGRYTLNGHLSSVTGDRQSVTPEGYETDNDRVAVVIDYDLRDATGRPITGGTITKHLDVSGAFSSDGYSQTVERGGGYAELQREVALAVARAALFRISPLRVVATEGNRIRLNYGSALLPLGSMISVDAGMSKLRFLVASGSSTGVVAELRGSGDPARIPSGALATFLEPDDPAANAPIYDRVDLP